MLIITYHSAPGLARQATFKKIKVKLDLLSDIDILLMVEKGIRGGICHTIHRYGNGNNKYIKDYDEKESSCPKHLDVIYLFGWVMSQELPVNDF